jgi:hypothetical protein
VCESSADFCFIGVVFHSFKECLITGGTCLDPYVGGNSAALCFIWLVLHSFMSIYIT